MKQAHIMLLKGEGAWSRLDGALTRLIMSSSAAHHAASSGGIPLVVGDPDAAKTSSS